MSKEVLRAISGIEIFPVISLVLFVTVFTVIVVWALRLDRRELEHAARLPLEPGADPGRNARAEAPGSREEHRREI
jgi:cbb3-type cytochrome oxidase subunit 3